MLEKETVLNPATGWLLLAIFGTIWIGLGVYWGRKAKNLEGFMLAGRNVGLALGAATAMATWVTSNTVMVAPSLAMRQGVWGMLAYSTACFGLLLFAPMALRIKNLIPNGYTSGDFIRVRYGRTAWSLFMVITSVYSMAWLVTMGVAGGKLIEVLTGIPYEYGMSVILFVCVAYTLFGGLFAVIGTDFIQSVIILIGVVTVGAVILSRLDMPVIYQSIQTEQPALLDVFMPVALLSLFNLMFFGWGEVFHNNVWWSRAFAIRKKAVSKAFLLAGFCWFPIPIAAGFIALSAAPLGVNIIDPDTTAPLVASHILGPVGAVLVFIVVFCSLASSIDSLLAATADLLTEDVYKRLIRPQASDTELRRSATFIIIGLGLATWAICWPKWDLLLVLYASGPLVASTIWPILAGLYWDKTNPTAASLAMLLGSVIGLWAYFEIAWYVATLISTVISMLVVVIGTYLAPSKCDWRRLSQVEPYNPQ